MKHLGIRYDLLAACIFVSLIALPVFSLSAGNFRTQAHSDSGELRGYIRVIQETFSFVHCGLECLAEPLYHAAPATGFYQPAADHPSGFGVLGIQTNSKYADDIQLKAAGYLEGRLTARLTFDHYYNLKAWLEKESALSPDSSCLLPNLAEHLSEDDGGPVNDEDDDAGEYDDDSDASEDLLEQRAEECGRADTLDVEEGLGCSRSAVQPMYNESTAEGSGCVALGGGVGDTVKAIMHWLTKMDRYVTKKVLKKRSRYYNMLAAIQSQLDGFIAGYTTAAAEGVDVPILARKDFTLLNGFGDAMDLMKALKVDIRAPQPVTDRDRRRRFGGVSRGSAVVKLAGDLSDVWMGHSSWFTYASMTRIWKQYNLSLSTGHHHSALSSYPGILSSPDSFYLLGDRAVMATSNPIVDVHLFKHLTPKAVPAWMRVRAANALGTSGRKWAATFARKNSGTDNSQYMFVDLARLERGARVKKHMLTVVEQIPGLVKWADMTRQLERGYWPSYGLPYFKEIYEKSGYLAAASLEQPSLEHSVAGTAQPSLGQSVAGAEQPSLGHSVAGETYQSAARANIFRRDIGKVDSLEDLKRLMRYNDYMRDSYSQGSPEKAICARFDLRDENPSPDGCIDTKVTSLDWVKRYTAAIVNGPTTDMQPPFTWDRFADTSHHGMPYNFTNAFETVCPNQPAPGPASLFGNRVQSAA